MTIKDSLISLLIIFIWGFNFVVISWGVDDLPPLFMGAARFLLVASLGSLFIKKPDIPWRWMAAYSLTLCFGQFALLFSAMAFGMPAGLASLVLQSQAVFTLILSALFLHETIKINQIIAMIFAGIGLSIIGFTGEHGNMTVIGFALTIAAAISWASGNVCNRMINQRGYQSNTGLVVWSSWIAMIPFFLTSLLFEGSDAILSSLQQSSFTTVFVIFYLAVAASILGYSLWSYLLSQYPAGQVAPLTLGVPVVGIICAALFLNESISEQQYLGICLVMVGLVINAVGGRWFKCFSRSTVS
ncbi:EamA family transporter [Thalassotalea castellviae]|uniref:EamA family transporter n=1 Tax=Thalassotalea castellviae TaxID=3075612 RepID=A0ABU2ZZS4_9GAMM|nr:EamA family transporter [Thalassotalea sp. W431]MDT0602383.1 EamA family transporter [Thalassotalea sp. W431]